MWARSSGGNDERTHGDSDGVAVRLDAGQVGTPLVVLESTDSTNKHAADLLAQGKVAHGAVILAHAQTAGRGQRGRVWHSGAGLDLTLSVVLGFQRLRADAQFALAKAVALAVHDTVAATLGARSAEARIKWPNDVLVRISKGNQVLRVAYGQPSVPGESVQAGQLASGSFSITVPGYVVKPNV